MKELIELVNDTASFLDASNSDDDNIEHLDEIDRLSAMIRDRLE